MSVTLRDFQPINNWKPDSKGEKWQYGEEKGTPKFIVDQTTKRGYLNESGWVVGHKCFFLTLGTPFVHPIAAIVNIAYRIKKLVILTHFWMDIEGEIEYNFKARLAEAGKDLLRIIASPIAVIGLELAAIYGMFRPYDGRKMYASIERAIYGDFILAPCFQPDPKYHAFGGDINKKDVF